MKLIEREEYICDIYSIFLDIVFSNMAVRKKSKPIYWETFGVYCNSATMYIGWYAGRYNWNRS